MSAENENAEDAAGGSPGLRRVLLDLWTGRQLALTVLVACAIAYLVFRGTPAVAFVLGRLRDIVVTVVLAGLLAYVIAPVVDVLCEVQPFSRGRTGRAAATLLVLVAVVAGLALLAGSTADPIIEETVKLYGLVETWLRDAPEHLQRVLQAYAEAALPPEIADAVTGWVRQRVEDVLGYAGQMALGVVVRGWYVVEALLVPVLAFYLVTDAGGLRDGFLRVIPDARRSWVGGLLDDANRTLQGYVRGQLILCAIAAVVTATTLYLLGVRVYLTLGLLAGLSRAVPVIGPIVAAIPIVAISWIQVDGKTAVVALVIFTAMNLIESKLLMPKVIGIEAALHPVVVILALLVGGEFFGVLGMFVAVPIVAVARVAFLRWQEAQARRKDPEPA